MLTKFQFRGLQDSTAYLSVDYRNFVMNHRGSFNELADALLKEGKKEKARETVLRFNEVVRQEIPEGKINVFFEVLRKINQIIDRNIYDRPE